MHTQTYTYMYTSMQTYICFNFSCHKERNNFSSLFLQNPAQLLDCLTTLSHTTDEQLTNNPRIPRTVFSVGSSSVVEISTLSTILFFERSNTVGSLPIVMLSMPSITHDQLHSDHKEKVLAINNF